MGKFFYKLGKVCNYWEFYREDIELMVELGYNVYCFLIEWSRFFFEEGKFNEDVFNCYREIIEFLFEKGIILNVILYYFILFLWFMRKGGFLKEENLKYWEGYVDKVVEFFKGVKFVVIFNELLVYVMMGYFMVYWLFFIKSFFKFFRVVVNLFKVYVIVYEFFYGKF